MPLTFETLSHGTIAFGFFNIETDLLLLDHLFFFAPDFCSKISELAKLDTASNQYLSWNIYSIDNYRKIGDLMGSIHGTNFQGFIGHVYKIFPFPAQKENFRQKTYGANNRDIIGPLLKEYAIEISTTLKTDLVNQNISIGEIVFSKKVFQELIQYVWRGGYPRWDKQGPPDYLRAMKKDIQALPLNTCSLFNRLLLE